MKFYPNIVPARAREEFQIRWRQLEMWFQQKWPYLLCLSLGIWLITHKDVTINFSMERGEGGIFQTHSQDLFYDPLEEDQQVARNVSMQSGGQIGTKALSAEAAEKRRRQLTYVEQHVHLARAEFREYGIPVSITMSQALLESNIGQSRLARENNNHFGIKCFSKSCKKGHCSNFNDDHHKDFFRIFASVEESYTAHSHILQKDRYSGLFRLESTDYRGWARGLKRAGYATDPRYAEKLIRIIEDLELNRYDS